MLIEINSDPGLTLYMTVERRSDGFYWRTDNSVFEAYNASRWAIPGYVIPLSETGGSGATGEYSASFPAGIVTAGLYRAKVHDQSAGSPSPLDEFVDDETIHWDGTQDISLTLLVNQGQIDIPASVLAAIASGVTLAGVRGDTWSLNITGLGSIVGRTKLWFTLKKQDNAADPQSLVQILEGVSGLVYLNGKPGTAGNGSLVVTNQNAGDVTLSLTAVASAVLPLGTWKWDIQMLSPAGVRTLTSGSFAVLPDITRATS